MRIKKDPKRFSYSSLLDWRNLLCWLCLQVAKSVSLRLYNQLEVVQKKNSQLEWENEALREKTQEMEVAKQVLQAEVEKAREVGY